ncbi:MAG: GNAT family N-acetyltransferase [Alphaproteobacteria bacterium]|nr:GNAT family N-acetyltransferase [Alphaproteobacteria bacterium]
MVIELTTPRLRLRPLVAGDQAVMTALFADDAVRRHLALGSLSDQGAANFAASFIASSHDEWRDGGCGALAVVLDENSRRGDLTAPSPAIGYCGLRLLPDRISAVELLYALLPAHWGQGLATEAAGAVLRWGFENLAVREIQAFTRSEHAASRRVMEKLGMDYLGETDRYYGETLAVYSLPRPPED